LIKVLFVHGERHPELKDLKTTFTHLREDLEQYLLKEERVLFPLSKKFGVTKAEHKYESGFWAD
jgi:regulator of cell morphogenesis and NO signaling